MKTERGQDSRRRAELGRRHSAGCGRRQPASGARGQRAERRALWHVPRHHRPAGAQKQGRRRAGAALLRAQLRLRPPAARLLALLRHTHHHPDRRALRRCGAPLPREGRGKGGERAVTHSIYLYIAIMAGVSFLIRTLPLTLIRRPITNRFLRSFLFYVPYVTLAVMTFPAIVQATQSPLAGALALVLGIALAFNGASLFTVAASCCAVVLIAEWLLL